MLEARILELESEVADTKTRFEAVQADLAQKTSEMDALREKASNDVKQPQFSRFVT